MNEPSSTAFSINQAFSTNHAFFIT